MKNEGREKSYFKQWSFHYCMNKYPTLCTLNVLLYGLKIHRISVKPRPFLVSFGHFTTCHFFLVRESWLCPVIISWGSWKMAELLQVWRGAWPDWSQALTHYCPNKYIVASVFASLRGYPLKSLRSDFRAGIKT